MLGDTIISLCNERLSVRRTPATTPIDGVYPDGTPTTFEIDAIVEPAPGAALRAAFDGQQRTDVRSITTLAELRTVSPDNEADVIANYDGSDWVIGNVERWPIPPGFGRVRPGAPTEYFRALAYRSTGGGS